MRKRNCRVDVYFTKNELTELTRKARKAGMSVGGFIRNVVSDAEVKEAPPADIFMLIREVRQVGSSLDRLLRVAEAQGLTDETALRSALEENRALEKLIVSSYTVPEA